LLGERNVEPADEHEIVDHCAVLGSGDVQVAQRGEVPVDATGEQRGDLARSLTSDRGCHRDVEAHEMEMRIPCLPYLVQPTDVLQEERIGRLRNRERLAQRRGQWQEAPGPWGGGGADERLIGGGEVEPKGLLSRLPRIVDDAAGQADLIGPQGRPLSRDSAKPHVPALPTNWDLRSGSRFIRALLW